MRSGEDRQADQVDVLVARGGRDLLGREPDALVDDLHARVARRDRDLLGAVGVTVEPGLADEDADRVAERVRRGPAPGPALAPWRRPTAACTPPTPVGARYSPNTSRSASAHSPTVPPARARRDGRRGEVVGAAATFADRVERARDRVAVARVAPLGEQLELLALDRLVDDEDVALAVERRRPAASRQVSVNAFTPTTVMSPDSMRRTRSALLCTSRCFIASIMANAPPPSSTHWSSASAASASSAVFASTTCEPSKRSSYSSRSVSNASTCWMRSDHCWSHGRGQPERLVPRRQLHRARPRVLRERDAERLEHDALHVVLGLRLGETERVHLHAVAEAAQLLVGDAVALGGDAVPERAEGAQLAHLLDEADPRVHEERDAPDDLGELVVVDLARRAHRVEHVDRGGERVRDLLDRRRARLLQVVRADVDRVPLRDVPHRVAHEVDGQPARRLGPEDVGARATGTP